MRSRRFSLVVRRARLAMRRRRVCRDMGEGQSENGRSLGFVKGDNCHIAEPFEHRDLSSGTPFRASPRLSRVIFSPQQRQGLELMSRGEQAESRISPESGLDRVKPRVRVGTDERHRDHGIQSPLRVVAETSAGGPRTLGLPRLLKCETTSGHLVATHVAAHIADGTPPSTCCNTDVICSTEKRFFFTAHPPVHGTPSWPTGPIVPHNSLSDWTKKPGSPQRSDIRHLSTLALQLQSLNPWK